MAMSALPVIFGPGRAQPGCPLCASVSGHRHLGLPILKNPTPVVRLLQHFDGAFAHRLIDRCGLRLMVNYMCVLD